MGIARPIASAAEAAAAAAAAAATAAIDNAVATEGGDEEEEEEAAAEEEATSAETAAVVDGAPLLPPAVLVWSDLSPFDLEALEVLAEKATSAGKARVEVALEAALTAGRCAVTLQDALDGSKLEAAQAAFAEAQALSLKGLTSAELRLQSLVGQQESCSSPSRGPVRTPVGSWQKTRADDTYGTLNRCSNLIFLDLELTAGFYEFEEKPIILEAAVIVTDKDLNEKGRGHWVIGGLTKSDLEGLGDFHQAHFRDAKPGGMFPPLANTSGSPEGGGNGLFKDVLASTRTKEEVEDAMLSLIQQHCPPGLCPLVGYSVQCDREVLKDEMPRLYRYVSHRIIDVSSFFQMARMWLPEKLRTWDQRTSYYRHRALDDVKESIEALRWARKNIFQSQQVASSYSRT
mmetsp:Transcript_75072/g.188977  ORF Transcript_75072/g.188977 Transcript_75072/m.188977 type:complete len:402 (+) Transcript_75072:395-1600(+)